MGYSTNKIYAAGLGCRPVIRATRLTLDRELSRPQEERDQKKQKQDNNALPSENASRLPRGEM